MYTQFQRFLATLLLFSMLLQSCHNPNLKLKCEEAPRESGSQQSDNPVISPKPIPVAPAQQILVPSHAVAVEEVSGTPIEGAHATPVTSPTIIAPSHAQDVSSVMGALTSLRTTSVKPSHTSGTSPKAKGATQHPSHKSAHVVLYGASLVKHTYRKEAEETDTPVPVGPSTHTTQLALPPQGVAYPSQIDVKPSTNNTAPKVSSSVASSNPVVPTYPSSQGHQVRFEKQARGAWLAQVQDGWGRVQKLPVICASNQTLEQAIQLLSGKDPAQYKYWVHVLETDQPPWAHKIVYVGALSIRGGSRRDRVSDNDRSSMGTLFTVGIGSQGMEMRFGSRNHHADSMAANNAVNEGIRRANETRRLVTSIPTSSLGLGLDTSAFTRSSLETPMFPRSSLHTPAFPRSSLETPTSLRSSLHTLVFPRSSLHTPAFESHRAREIQIQRRQEHEREEQWDRESEEFFRRSRQRADEQHARAVWEAEQRKREAWEREQELERARARHEREAWERERERERHAREEKHDYEAFCRGEAPTPSATNSTSGQQRAESPQRSSSEPDCVAALSKQAYFLWKEQAEIRIAKEAEEQAKKIYLSRRKKQEEIIRQEAPLREQEARRARLDEAYRREERRRQEAPRREQEERRARLDETYRREEERRRQSVLPTAAHVPAARVQENEDDNVEEVYTDYPAIPNINDKNLCRYGKVVFGRLWPDKEGNLRPCDDLKSALKGFKKFDEALNMPATPTPLPASSMPLSMFERMHRAVKIPPLYPETSTPEVASVAKAQKEDGLVPVVDANRKLPAKPTASAKQEVSSTDTAIQQQRSGAVVLQGLVLDSEGKLQPHEVRVPFANPAGFQAFPGTTQDTPVQGEEDRKPAASLTPSGSPAETEQSVKAYIRAFQASTPEECAAMQSQGEQLLKSVEALKITKKESYRRQVEIFETQDVDPVVWGTVLQKQHDNKVQTGALRDLRSQLVDILQPSSEVLETAGIKATTNEDNAVAYYSSDEDEQPLSSEEMQRRRELCKEVAEITKEVVEGIIESGPTLGTGAVVKVAGKTLKMAKAAGVSKKAAQATEASKKVVQGSKVAGQGVTSAIKKAGLPSEGKIRFIPRSSDVQSGKILKQGGGYVDKFGNVWKKSKGDIIKGPLHWDVQLSQTGKTQLGHMSSSGGAHLNVTNYEEIHH